MITPRPTGRRFLAEAVPLALAALLAVSLPAEARGGGHSGGGHSGGGHSAHATGGSRGSSSPSRSQSHGSASTPRTAHPVPQTPGAGRQPNFDRGRGHGHFGHGPRVIIGSGFFYDPFFYNFYYPYGYWGGWWGPDYDPYYNARPREYYDRDRDEMGALDLDVSPGRTEVWVNGERLGVVDSFDGWPDYLWLPKGTYDVVFYLDGYKTIARQITVYPGNVLDIDDRMEEGPSTRPEDLATKTHERRDQRLRDEHSRRYSDDSDGEDEGWHDRVRRDRSARRGQDGDYRGRPPAADDSARGRLVLGVEPEDASVYVDGRFVGTGTDLSMMHSGLPLAAGDHKLAVVRPGRRAQEKTFTVKAGEDVKLDVSLDEAGPGR
ncbi:MAG TPA: PEGA domain-containing protein [Thermoanaerobaculia bacterium]|nr:PEGA domain-containing protein [Thermoanaerobaculia bacterium]